MNLYNNFKTSDITHSHIPQESAQLCCQDLYMLLPTEKWMLVLAGIYILELLLWNLYFCVYVLLCASDIIASENELYLPYI